MVILGLPTCGAEKTVLFLLPSFADINNAEETLIVGREDVPLESVLDGCHGGCYKQQIRHSAMPRDPPLRTIPSNKLKYALRY